MNISHAYEDTKWKTPRDEWKFLLEMIIYIYHTIFVATRGIEFYFIKQILASNPRLLWDDNVWLLEVWNKIN